MLVFVPLSPAALRGLPTGAPLRDVPAWAATPAFMAGLDLTPGDRDDQEVAEHEALTRAADEGRERHGVGLLAVAQAEFTEYEAGRGTAPHVAWPAVTSFFAEDPADGALMWFDRTELGRTFTLEPDEDGAP
ncbi:MAG: hypothetical protein LBS56_06690 [Propionibacteriaceae bacterium]|jgi:hypothetical protein|nr:hypothetical protein [Propionibacteriaceae bacterium]